ncbi:hypothetical protein [Homoserinimonas sp. OAct 916]|uniref:hypothetical protein n=1 Tax=Homoserinimonas sp. OAct 916 TaxID=2211450 RepID=UPI000DBE3824|nr:hypothetical protein [Homoserinimonas sp. OAct 916]
MAPLTLPAMTTKQEASWRGIIAVAKIVRGGWCLIGGQMVQLWCWERQSDPMRPTDDGDAVLDIRAHPTIMREFTQALVDCGFEPDGEDWRGHQHRWTDGEGQIDILLPEGIGARAKRIGVRGGTTLETPGAQNVLDRAEPLEVLHLREVATVYRPTLQGALLGKAFAYGITRDPLRGRHLQDLAILSSLIRISDRVGDGLNRKERDKLFTAYEAAMTDPLATSAAGAAEGLDRLRVAAQFG